MSLDLIMYCHGFGLPSGEATHDRPRRIPRAGGSGSKRVAATVLALLTLMASTAQAVTLELRPAVSADDAEESATGSMYINSSDLELTQDATTQTIGIRWPGVTIPTGATITAAWVQFAAKETHSEVTNLTIRGTAVDNAAAFVFGSGNISLRPFTTASVAWAPAAWTAGQVGASQRSPDLSDVIRQIVGRAGWASGNALALVITGTGHRTTWAWDGNAALSPLLHVEYTTGAPPVDNPPVASVSASQNASPAFTVTASGANSTDADATPIASFRFDFGDGTAAVVINAPTTSATHTYAGAGTYTITLTATDTGGLTSAAATTSITVSAVDSPPVANLSVSAAASPPLTVNASGAGSTDTDATPIASYRFTFGDGTAAVVTTAPTATASHTYATSGTYTVTLIVTDTGGLTSAAATASITVSTGTSTTLEKRPAAVADDAEESATGKVSLSSSDLELTQDSSNQTVGMRWSVLAIPPGATITAAWIQFTAKQSHSNATSLTFRGEAVDNAATFTTVTGNVSLRPRTTAATTWVPLAWTAGQAGPNQRTPDLSDVIREVVSRPGWASGNALALIVTGVGSGRRSAWSRDGNQSLSPLLHVEFTGGTVTDLAPVARLTVSQAASPARTVNATGAASTDTDATPIASYRFTFGDGTAAVVTTAPTATASHTYAATGTYTVTLTATDTGGLISAPTTASITVTEADNPPVARLSVSVAASPPLTVNASGAASTDTDATPIASYRFTFGDGTAAVVTTAPTATASHTYAAAGTYTVTLTATDTGGLTSAAVTASVTVGATSGPPIAVHVGYYDTHHPDNPRPKPNPWMGSPGIVFVGTPDTPSGGWDSSALRFDNLSASSITAVVTVDIGSHHYALWGSRSIPANGTLVLAQTGFENFDGSDTNPAGCYGCNPDLCISAVQSTVPVVHVAIGGTTTNYYDTGQILNTYGVDAAGCPPTSGRNDESSPWTRIYTTPPGAPVPAASNALEFAPSTERVGSTWLAAPFPNPVHRQCSIRFSTAQRGQVQLAFYDIAGRLVQMPIDHELEAGEYNKVVPLEGAHPGVYYCRLQTPEGTLKQTFVIMP